MKNRLTKPNLLVSLLALLVCCGFLSIGFVIGQHNPQKATVVVYVPPIEPSDINIYQLWIDTNDQRTIAGVPPLSLNAALNQSASAKCNDMVQKNYWSHNDPSGNTPWHFFTAVGIPDVHLGENLGEGFDNAASLFSAWVASPDHESNIVDPKFTDVGFAVCKSNSFIANSNLPTLIVVQHFAEL